MTSSLKQRLLLRCFISPLQFIDGFFYGMEIVIIDEDIFVMVKIRLELEILDVGLFYASDGMKLDKLFALQCAFFPIE
jgi:hypothetical protein